MYRLKCDTKTFLHLSFAVNKTFVIFRNAFIILRNRCHCRYNELIIFIMVYFLLHIPSFFVSVTQMFVFHDAKPLVRTRGYDFLGHIRQV